MSSMRTRPTSPPSAARCSADILLLVTASRLAPFATRRAARSSAPAWQAIKRAVYPCRDRRAGRRGREREEGRCGVNGQGVRPASVMGGGEGFLLVVVPCWGRHLVVSSWCFRWVVNRFLHATQLPPAPRPTHPPTLPPSQVMIDRRPSQYRGIGSDPRLAQARDLVTFWVRSTQKALVGDSSAAGEHSERRSPGLCGPLCSP